MKKFNTQDIYRYDYILSDIYGVIHNGGIFFADVKKSFVELKKAGKNICLVSNAPRLSTATHERLIKNGLFDANFTLPIVTSGDVFFHDMKKIDSHVKYYFIGFSDDLSLFNELVNFTQIHNPRDADIVVISNTFGIERPFDMQILKEIIDSGVTIYAINPDLIVRPGKKTQYCAGAVAKLLEFAGREVIYYGKPYQKTYDFVEENFKFKREKTLFIGDSFETDIVGADIQNIDSLLVLSGIHDHQIDFSDDISIEKSVEKLAQKYKTKSTFFSNIFSI